MSEFHLAGAIPPTAKCYANRRIDRELFEKATQGAWSLVLAPRQQGKTSALLRLTRALSDQGVRAVLVDLQSKPLETPYDLFLQWFARKLRGSELVAGNQTPEPTGAERFQLENWLQWAIGDGQDNIVVAIDEASAIRSTETRHSFFAQLRAIANKRGDPKDGAIFQRLTFLFAGTFRPESLVPDENSPFNVCDRLDPADLLLDEVLTLSKLLERENAEDVASAIYAATLGQPFLTQLILEKVERSLEGSELDVVTRTIEELKAGVGDRGHIADLFQLVLADSKLVASVVKLCHDGTLQNDAANSDLSYLRVAGLIRRDGGVFKFRNPIYEHVARGCPYFAAQPANGAGPSARAMFVLPEGAFDFVKDVNMKEYIYSSQQAACQSMNCGNHRLALAGYGCALECLLMYLLGSITAADLAVAVQKAEAAPGGVQWQNSDKTRPSEWSLFNMVKVAKQVKGVGGPLEISDALREWRNLMHPVLALKAAPYKRDADLAPEAIQAYGKFAGLHRDLSLILK